MSLPYFPVIYHTIIINFIENILSRFESCFSRKAAFGWFVILTTGLMLRSDRLGILAGSIRKWVCIPLSIRFHDGLQAATGWKEASVSSASHVVQMVQDAYRAASVLGNFILLLNRYFLTVSALETLKSLNEEGTVRMEIVTKAKRSCTAYEKPGSRKLGRGRLFI